MSDNRLRAAALALSAAGVLIAGYLTYVHYAELDPVCVGGGGGCERVQASEYSELAGIPVAVIGLVGYVAVAIASFGRSERALLAASVLALTGAGFSLYLTYLELFVIDAICQWCVVSLVVMCALAAVAVIRLLRSAPDRAPSVSGTGRVR
jgi:uncharacterized membrane protein